MTILPSEYWGDIEYWAAIVQDSGSCVLDTGENFVKRSQRNRTVISTSQGRLSLSVHVRNANRPGQPMRDIRIDYAEPWHRRHLTAITSSYRTSPFYSMFEDRFRRFYEREWKYLLDYDMEIHAELLSALHLAEGPEISGTYMTAMENDLDLRDKSRESRFTCPEYFQPFSDRQPFMPNISILDLLMSEGPSCTDTLQRSRL